ncbi:MAG: TraB/GumN family protein [Candidatus Woesearchaeota archaeon]|nr:TraB/GumN family protein [Candidatus Woesearchaeota archaeon]
MSGKGVNKEKAGKSRKKIAEKGISNKNPQQWHSENLMIIGTSHIAEESVVRIRNAILNWKPNVVALELDHNRFYSLMNPEKGDKRLSRPSIRKVGIKGFLFTVVGSFLQRKLGERVGVEPGSDMKTAAEDASRNNIPVMLIDQDIELTLSNFSNALTLRERWNLFSDFFMGLIFRKDIIEFDISKVPDKKTIETLISKLRERYPGIYKSLIEDRNIFMAKKIARFMKSNPEKKILAVVGAGHEDAISLLVSNYVMNSEIIGNEISYKFSYSINNEK